jgi:hypothetical protein
LARRWWQGRFIGFPALPVLFPKPTTKPMNNNRTDAAKRTGENGDIFVKLPVRIRNRLHELSGAEIKIWIAYLTHANTDNIAWPSLETLQKETGLSEDWISQSRSTLTEKGWFVRCGSEKKSGRFGSPRYQPVIPSEHHAKESPARRESGPEIVRAEENQADHTVLSQVHHPGQSTVLSSSIEVEPEKKSATVVAAAWDFAFGVYREKFHESPNWFKKDSSELDALFNRKRELTLEEFQSRWTSYVKSTDPFYAKNGFSLGFFCRHAFDALRLGPQNERSRDAEEKPYGGLARRELERRRSELSPEAKKLYEQRGIRVQ